MKYYSQYNQDKWLYENHFKDKTNGVFVEIGADDGIDKSNTKFFEDLGWSGLCIEPSPNRFLKLKENRSCICEDIALSDYIGSTEFLDISGWGKGLSGLIEDYNPQHKIRINQELNHIENKGKENIEVKVDLLNNVLEKHQLYEIDFCTVDTEGSEFKILKELDFNKFNIKIFLVENNYGSTEVRELLQQNNYELVGRLSIDDVFVKKLEG